MINGIGYQEYKKMRRINEQLTTTAMEMPGNERYVIYFGRAHVVDFESGVIARGHLKIGRGKFVTALQRGRNQPGIDFRVYGEIVLDSNQATRDAENIIKEALAHRHIVLSQGQQEMYQFKDDEINNVLTTIAEIIESETSHTVIEINLYHDNKPTSIKQSTGKFLIKENNTHNLMFG